MNLWPEVESSWEKQRGCPYLPHGSRSLTHYIIILIRITPVAIKALLMVRYAAWQEETEA